MMSSSSTKIANTSYHTPKKSSMKRTDSSSDRSLRSSGKTPKIRFHSIQIIRFPQILGDNPACSTGAPLTLDWKPLEQETVLIDYYEFTRNDPRTRKELQDTREDRNHYLLIECGYHQSQISQVLAEIETIKKQRLESAKSKGGGAASGFFKVMNSAIKSVPKQTTKLVMNTAATMIDVTTSATAAGGRTVNSIRARSA